MNNTRTALQRFLPYALILIFSLFGTFILFFDGIFSGDDFIFHNANILDKLTNLQNGKPLSSISGNLALGLGMGGTLFYSPIPHNFVAILAHALSFFGCSLLTVFKLVLFSTVFVSGIFMYRFAMHISKNNIICSLIASAIYVLYPYRLFDAFCRFAFAEAFSFLFIPLFLMGLYDIVNMDKEKFSYIPFIETILGGAFLYLTHNLTAVLVFILGIFYLLISVRTLFTLMKKPKFLVSCAFSVILLIGIASIGMFSQLQLMGMSYYNITDENAMWTNPEHLIDSIKNSQAFSGFLNTPWLYDNGINSYDLIMGNVVFFCSIIILVAIDFSLERLQCLKRFRLPGSIAIGFIVLWVFAVRAEVILGYFTFAILYIFNALFISVDNEKIEPSTISKRQAKINLRKKMHSLRTNSISYEFFKIFKHKEFWMCIFGIALACLFMSSEYFWNIAPSFLRKLQFSWRAWSLVQVCISILACYLVLHIKIKHITTVFACVCAVLIVFSQPLIEKRSAFEQSSPGWSDEINKEELFNDTYSTGSCREYCPVILTDKNYVSSYDNSLCYQIRNDLLNNYHGKDDYYHNPVFLTGGGSIDVTYSFAPVYEMEISAEQDGLVQMPLIYYPGYKITVVNQDTSESYKIDATDTDGLISFFIDEGNYLVKTAYEGTALRKSSLVLCPVSLLVVCGFGIYELVICIKKRKAEQI